MEMVQVQATFHSCKNHLIGGHFIHSIHSNANRAPLPGKSPSTVPNVGLFGWNSLGKTPANMMSRLEWHSRSCESSMNLTSFFQKGWDKLYHAQGCVNLLTDPPSRPDSWCKMLDFYRFFHQVLTKQIYLFTLQSQTNAPEFWPSSIGVD